MSDRALMKTFSELPPMYNRYLSSSLKERLLSLAEQPDHERMRLDQEIDLTRESVMGLVKLFDLACENLDKAMGTEHQEAALLLHIDAGARMRSGLDAVASLCERVVRMRAAGKESVPIHAVNMLVMQVTKIAHETLPEEFVPDFVNRLNQGVRVSDDEMTRGTHLTPDQDARDMDATIPMFVKPPQAEQERA
jgi:hypothetical protein